MTIRTCEHESRLLAAHRAGELPAWANDHLASCESCALALDAERWMSAAAEDLAPATLPSPAMLLLRARLRARHEAEQRALQPLDSWRAAALAIGGAALATIATLHGGLFGRAWSASMTPSQAIFAIGVVVAAGLPFWQRLRATWR